MTNESTINKLIEMRMSALADAFRLQLEDASMFAVSFEDRFGLLVDLEYTTRKNNRRARLIRNASFDQPEANVHDINYTSGRKLNKQLIERLSTCEFITGKHNIIITGSTGSGKSYLACALGMEAASAITPPNTSACRNSLRSSLWQEEKAVLRKPSNNTRNVHC